MHLTGPKSLPCCSLVVWVEVDGEEGGEEAGSLRSVVSAQRGVPDAVLLRRLKVLELVDEQAQRLVVLLQLSTKAGSLIISFSS